jgi:ATP-dependent Zn protease
MTEAQKESTAYHEAGHAIIGRLVPITSSASAGRAFTA